MALASVTPWATPIVIASPTPIPTPIVHIVQPGETLISIALDYGVALEALQAANPGVLPEFLAIGQTLIIPPPIGTVVASNVLPSPTPAMAAWGPVTCYPQPGGRLACLVEVLNPHAQGYLENVGARIILADANGRPLASGISYSAVEAIPPGGTGPVAVVFPAPPVGVAGQGVEIVSAEVVETPTLAHPLLAPSHVGLSQNGLWVVTGEIANPTAQTLTETWVVITLYDVAQALIGYQRHALGALAPNATRSFAVRTSRLSGAVARYMLTAEGRP
jgi:LysM repeat protein